MRVNPELPKVFYEVLFEHSDLIFYKEHFVVVKEGQNFGLAKADKKFSSSTRYYVIKNGRKPVKMRLSKRHLLSLFPGRKASEMEDYAEANGLALKEEADYIKLFMGVYQGL